MHIKIYISYVVDTWVRDMEKRRPSSSSPVMTVSQIREERKRVLRVLV
jgi:hypothetical protein